MNHVRPAILVSPVLKEGAATLRLPAPFSRWYDFWSGTRVLGGRDVQAEAAGSIVFALCPRGSILPGPEIEYADEAPPSNSASTLELTAISSL